MIVEYIKLFLSEHENRSCKNSFNLRPAWPVRVCNGVIIESLADKKRTLADSKSRITTLADISIYTTEGEIKLQEVFLKMREVLGDADAPSSKAAPEELKALFAKAVPDYDADRFYVSHMKKVVDWYGDIKKYASFDFVDPEEEASHEEAAAEDAKEEDKANE